MLILRNLLSKVTHVEAELSNIVPQKCRRCGLFKLSIFINLNPTSANRQPNRRVTQFLPFVTFQFVEVDVVTQQHEIIRRRLPEEQINKDWGRDLTSFLRDKCEGFEFRTNLWPFNERNLLYILHFSFGGSQSMIFLMQSNGSFRYLTVSCYELLRKVSL